jgi:hypothetical protein
LSQLFTTTALQVRVVDCGLSIVVGSGRRTASKPDFPYCSLAVFSSTLISSPRIYRTVSYTFGAGTFFSLVVTPRLPDEPPFRRLVSSRRYGYRHERRKTLASWEDFSKIPRKILIGCGRSGSSGHPAHADLGRTSGAFRRPSETRKGGQYI